ncbi:RNA polymerase-binding transcription factor DksA [Lipingzhangella halophila]|uniref:RNA polymerase-binding transcription factor DksA n=1 Tax=Lipingzhangella halophila TaxID=1783352 RepID=A0A7W7RIW8_9ACTN|nr:TraR/DksA C4-type zinc finger protein [Lipingzhangella halophila]MBB4932822.1 RNA polymerase-binding transcription factor DksA [Lipingzhangella halophila]
MDEAADPPERSGTDHHAAAERIRQARAEAAGLAQSLMRQWDGVVEAAALTGNDDEHDPEGPTVAYERQQLQAMREHVRGELTDLDRAAQRLHDGVYWTCAGCGGPIGAARLSARPTARTCIGCASRGTARTRYGG